MNQMTVCIAAICNWGREPRIVGASDRIITMRDVEFEPDQTKHVFLASHTVALFAGEMTLHAEVCPQVYAEIGAILKKKTPITVQEIAGLYAKGFAEIRRRDAEREILWPNNLDFKSFLSKKQRDLAPEFVKEL